VAPVLLQIAGTGRQAVRNLQSAPAGAPDFRLHSQRSTRHAGCYCDCAGGPMIDLLLVLATAAFFALSWGYVRLCEKL